MANAHLHRQRVNPTKSHDPSKCMYCTWIRNGKKGKPPKHMNGHRPNPGK